MYINFRELSLIILLFAGLLCACSPGGALPNSPTEELSPTKKTQTAVSVTEQPKESPDLKLETLEITLETPSYSIVTNEEGFDEVELEGFTLPGVPAVPALPHKVYNIALPPNAELDNLSVEVVDLQMMKLAGTYKIMETSPDLHTGDQSGQTLEPDDLSDNFVKLLPPGQMRKWRFARLDFSPFLYDPESGELNMVSEIIVQLKFYLSEEPLDVELLADDIMDDQAQEFFINYDSAKDWYLIPDSH